MQANTARASLDYASAGVDIDKEGSSVRALLSAVGAARSPRAPNSIGSPVEHGGGFSGLISFGDQLLGMCTDGVGSKMVLASEMDVYDTVGIDCMAMNVNDLLCVGCEPLAFVDYIAAARPDPQTWQALGRGLAQACLSANVTLAGGETATLPDLVRGVDVSGTALGSVPRGKQIDGESVRPGDAIIGLPSSGLHSNGYTLARSIVKRAAKDLNSPVPFALDENDRNRLWRSSPDSPHTLGGALLTPTAIYVDPLVPLFKAMRQDGSPAPYNALHGVAHITGGGLSNLLRLSSSNAGYHIHSPLPVHTDFEWLQREGGVEDVEMYRVFNMGMGMCVVVAREHADAVASWLASRMTGSRIVGEVTDSGMVTHAVSSVSYSHY